jgi:hypothetical protein
MVADGHRGKGERGVTRREALRQGAGACAGGAAMLGLLGPDAEQALAEQLRRYGRSAVDPSAQNAILIVTDSTRADYLGASGSSRATDSRSRARTPSRCRPARCATRC